MILFLACVNMFGRDLKTTDASLPFGKILWEGMGGGGGVEMGVGPVGGGGDGAMLGFHASQLY